VVDIDLSVIAQAAILVPFILGLVEVVKRATGSRVSDDWSPVFAIIIGIGLAFIVIDVDWQRNVLAGIVAGLSASGLWSGTKAVQRAAA
jgi:hypothetical protein